MHPLYKTRRRHALIIGWALLVLGIIGNVLPFLQGILFMLVGLSILSLHLTFAQNLRAKLALKFPSFVAHAARLEAKVYSFVRLTTHTREYVSITNRDGMVLALIVEVSELEAGTAVLLHSASGTKDSPTSELLAERARERGFSVVRFDAVHGMGESGGHFTLTRAGATKNDLEDVIAWVKAQPWYHAPLVLAGHSLGGLVAGLYAAEHPSEVAELILLAPTVSGARYEEAYGQSDPEGFAKWRESGARSVKNPRTGVTESLPWHFVEDLRQYDLIARAGSLTMPTTVLVGTNDRTTLVVHGEELVRTIGLHARLVTVPGLRHTPLESEEFTRLRTALKEWPSSP